MTLIDGAGHLLGAMPLYLKSHSLGEYVFDHGWAEAYERAGGRYYPKLLAAVPFTPVTGPRLLVRPELPYPKLGRTLIAGAVTLAEQNKLSSLHITFPTETEWRLCGEMGLLQRTGEQFHWRNRDYGGFDDFLGDLSARKRKTIRRERRDATANGITVETLSGSDLREEHWDAMFGFYMDTGCRKWGRPYLNRDFFRRLHDGMADAVVLNLARRAGRWIAGALNLKGRDTLYGRYWGAIEHHPFLHFELCYYRAIDYAIAHKLDRVEAGAQGEHKLARGYLPVATYSAHHLCDQRFHRAVAQFLDRERRHVAAELDALAQYSPFRRGIEETD